MWRQTTTRINHIGRRRRSLAVFMFCCQPSVVTPLATTTFKTTAYHSTFHSSSARSASHDDGNSGLSFKEQDEEYLDSVKHLPRVYIGSTTASNINKKLAAESLVSLSYAQANYLNVMRLSNVKRWGQWAGHLRVFNGSDGEWLAKLVDTSSGVITNTKRKRPSPRNKKNNNNQDTAGEETAAMVECLQRLRDQPERDSNSQEQNIYKSVELHMGRLKKARRRWILEKVTELGISGIHVVDTQFSVQTEPWEYDKHFLQVVEASEQCERLTIPTLSASPTPWDELIHFITTSSSSDGPHHQWLVCRERSPTSRPILRVLGEIGEAVARQSNDTNEQNLQIAMHLLVGPEGGWSPDELDELTEISKQQTNLHFVSLGDLVLRAETAAISAVSAVMMSLEDLNSS